MMDMLRDVPCFPDQESLTKLMEGALRGELRNPAEPIKRYETCNPKPEKQFILKYKTVADEEFCVNPVAHYQLTEDGVKVDFDSPEALNWYSHRRRFAAMVIESTETAAVQAILEAAREDGLTDVYLMDRDFVLDALKEKLERESAKPLSIEQMLTLDAPVWWGDETGFWCLCQNGMIICPSGANYDVREIPGNTFYRDRIGVKNK